MISTYCLDRVLDIALNGMTIYAGLSSTPADKYGTGYSEPISNNYSRPRVDGFTPSEDGKSYNAEPIRFPISTGVWFSESQKAAYWLLFDGQGEDASLLACGHLSTPKDIDAGVAVSIPEQSLGFALSDLGDMLVFGGNADGAVLNEYDQAS